MEEFHKAAVRRKNLLDWNISPMKYEGNVSGSVVQYIVHGIAGHGREDPIMIERYQFDFRGI